METKEKKHINFQEDNITHRKDVESGMFISIIFEENKIKNFLKYNFGKRRKRIRQTGDTASDNIFFSKHFNKIEIKIIKSI